MDHSAIGFELTNAQAGKHVIKVYFIISYFKQVFVIVYVLKIKTKHGLFKT